MANVRPIIVGSGVLRELASGDSLVVGASASGRAIVDASALTGDLTLTLADLASAGGRYTTTITGDGSTTQFTVTHSFNTRYVVVSVNEDSSGNPDDFVLVDWKPTSANAIQITFAVAPSNGVIYHVAVIAAVPVSQAVKVFTGSSSSLANGSSVTVTHDADSNFRRDISACNDISRETGGGTTALLLNCNGTDGSTTITDSSLNALTGTRGGTTCEIDTAQGKYGGASLLLSSGRIDFDNAALAMGTGDGAIEGWLRFSSNAGTQVVFDQRLADVETTSLLLYFSSGTPVVYFNGGAVITGGSALSSGQWYHWAITRSGPSLRLFIDGTQSGSTYTLPTNNNFSRTKFRFGGDYASGGSPFAGWLDDVRISTGTARYTATFTPPGELSLSTYTVRTPLRISNAHVGDSGSVWVEEGDGAGANLTTKTTFTNQTGKTLANFVGVVEINPFKVAG